MDIVCDGNAPDFILFRLDNSMAMGCEGHMKAQRCGRMGVRMETDQSVAFDEFIVAGYGIRWKFFGLLNCQCWVM